MRQNRDFGGPVTEGLFGARVGEAIEQDKVTALTIRQRLVALPSLMLGVMLATKTARALNRTADRPCYRSDAPFATRAGALKLICRAGPQQILL